MLVWKTQTLNVNVASLRYRCLFPLHYLAQKGVRSAIYGGPETVKLTAQTQALIFVKSFRAEDVEACEQAYQLGVPIILDLCDNIFIDQYATDNDYNPAENFCLMARRAAAIVITGTAMKAEVKRVLAPLSLSISIVVIPDGNEALDDIDFAFSATRWRRLKGIAQRRKSVVQRRMLQQVHRPLKFSRRIYRRGKHRLKTMPRRFKGKVVAALRRLRQRGSLPNLSERAEISQRASKSNAETMARTVNTQPACSLVTEPKTNQKKTDQKSKKSIAVEPTPLRPAPWPPATAGVKTVLWFGNHGAKYGNFGMLNILEVAPALASISRQQPLRLMVVSNSRQRYEESIAPLPFETDYLPWHPRQIYAYIRASDAVIIPNSQSVYSICKSANRAVLALSQGTPVVASRTPALAMFSEGVWLDDWEAGLQTYLRSPEIAKAHVAKAQEVIAQNLSGDAIAQKWLSLLQTLTPAACTHARQSLTPGRLAEATADSLYALPAPASAKHKDVL